MKKKSILLFTSLALVGLGLSSITSCGQDKTEEPPILIEQKIIIEGSTTVTIGQSVTYTAKSNDVVLEGVIFKSSNKSVGVIDSDGLFTPLSVGTTRISAELQGYESASIEVTVVNPELKEMTISTSKSSIKVGETVEFSASEDAVIWSSTDTNVATIGKNNGIARGQGVGTTTITATKDGFNPATFLLTVEANQGEDVETYTITYSTVPGLTWNATQNTAKKGDTVSFTVTISEGSSLVSVKYNGTEITPNNGTYSFIMPASDVILTAELVSMANVSIGGDLSIALIEDSDGIYKAKGVEIKNDSSLYYLIKDEVTGEYNKLNFQNFDFTKCFGRIHSSRDYKNYQFDISGGFTYDFYYDPANGDRPCYIKRTSVNNLPNGSSIDAFENLFDSGAQQPTTYPDNVKSVRYTSTVSQDDYRFTKYKNNKSYAEAKMLNSGTKKAEVYKNLEGNTYTVVDTYQESKNDPTKKDDTTVFSGKYNVVDEYTNNKKYEYLTKDAIFDANAYSHNYYSLEFDIMYAYRVGFGVDEGTYTLKSMKRNFESVSNPSGGFVTTITSSKTYDDEKYKYHFEYLVTIDFNKDGSINNGTYSEKRYNEDDYDFANDKFKTGGKERGTSVKELTFAYEYGTNLEEAPEYNEAPYFISEISNVRINNDSINKDKSINQLKKNDWIEKSRGTLKYNYAPETALDDWQYDVISSSNTNVIDHSNVYTTYEAVGFGESDLVIGNHTTNKVTSAPVKVTVPNDGVELRYPYWNSVWGQTSQYNVIDNTADDVFVYAGIKSYIGLYTSPQGADNTNFTFTVSDPDLVSVEYNPKNYLFTIDATNAASLKESKKVTLTVTWPKGSKNLGITLIPLNATSEDKVVGTWVYEGDKSSPAGKLVLTTDETYSYSGSSYNKGTIEWGTYTLTFGWEINNKKQLVIKGGKLVDTKDGNYMLDHFNLDYDSDNDKLGVSLTLSSWDGLDSGTTVSVFGDYYTTDDEFVEYFTDFSRKN